MNEGTRQHEMHSFRGSGVRFLCLLIYRLMHQRAEAFRTRSLSVH